MTASGWLSVSIPTPFYLPALDGHQTASIVYRETNTVALTTYLSSEQYVLSWAVLMARYQGSSSITLEGRLETEHARSISIELAFTPETSVGNIEDCIAKSTKQLESSTTAKASNVTSNVNICTTSLILPWKSKSKEEYHLARSSADRDVLQLRLEKQKHTLFCRGIYKEGVGFNAQDAQRIVQQFVHIAQSMQAANRDNKVDQLLTLSEDDEQQLLKWNANPPPPIDKCFQDLFAMQVLSDATRPAVSASDGELTYGQLDHLSSQLATVLLEHDISTGTVVPLLFEKSKWMTVGMLAVAKVRAVAVCLCSTHPDQAIEAVFNRINPTVIVSSELQAQRLKRVGRLRIIIPQKEMDYNAPGRPWSFVPPKAQADDVAFIIFTSGSTGAPKGIVLTHRAISTVCHHAGERLEVDRESRVLQFSSYAFDMSIFETWQALARGGCLCVPSERQRLNSIPEFTQKHRVSWAFFTPSTIINYDPKEFPTIKALALGGESLGQDIARQWGKEVRLFNAWGPAEVGVAGAIEVHPSTWTPGTFGKAVGCIAWITMPDDSDILTPIGTVGEVIIEGAVVAEGYLNDSTRTSQVFIPPPRWRARFDKIPIQGRFFKTGDLCHYNADGTIRYLSRKDTTVKIRGQRVDVDAVELQLRQLEPGVEAVVAGVLLKNAQGPILIAFIINVAGIEVDWRNTAVNHHKPDVLSPSCVTLGHRYLSMLRPQVPPYMVPSFIMPFKSLPRTATDKVDRKRLCNFVSIFSFADLAALTGTGQKLSKGPSKTSSAVRSVQEQELVEAIGEVLDSPALSIDLESSFLHIGGDSVSAIRVMRRLMDNNKRLLVECLLDADMPLRSVAKEIELCHRKEAEDHVHQQYPFLQTYEETTRRSLLSLAAEQCQITKEDIDDLYPTTPLQEGLMAITETKGAEAYTDRFLFTMPPGCDITQAQRAWEAVVHMTSILRTRIILAADGGTYQVVCKPSLPILWQSASTTAEFLDKDRVNRMGLGSPLMRLAIIRSAESNILALTLHHAIYDGFTLHFCVQQAERAYQGCSVPRSDFSHFIRHLHENERSIDRTRAFWKQETLHLNSVVFPKHSSPDVLPRASCAVHYETPRAVSRTLQLGSPTAKVRLAWALLVSMYTGSDDVTYGVVVDGRRNLQGDLAATAGPTIATYPFRLVIRGERTVQQSLAAVQAKIDATVPFEQTGLQQIRQMGTETASACDFHNLLIVQTEDTLSASPVFGSATEHLGSMNSFPGYSIILLCTPSKNAWRFEMFVDEEVWPRDYAEHMLCQLGHILQQLDDTCNKNVPLERLNLISPEDQARLIEYNGTFPLQSLSSIPELIHSQVVLTPQQYAICAWDGDFTYQQLHDHAAQLALRLRPLIIRDGVHFVPILFERSKWVPVAMLAVSLTGAAFVLLEPSHPLERNVQIYRTVGAKLGLTSQTQLKLAQSIADGPWIIPGTDTFNPSAPVNGHTEILPKSIAANDLLYAVFTSGSTGNPKGVLIEHGSYCSAILAQKNALGITADSRVLQISSYAFDSFAVEILTFLASGGCVCIPSHDEVHRDLAGAIQRFQATWLCITPSMLRLLSPEEVPSLQIVVAVGESMLPGQIAQWCDRVQLLCGYGPTECCTGAASHRITSSTADVRTIGTGMGCLLWVVHPDDVEILMPVNTIGELVLQGPIVGRGYLNDTAKTAESFIETPTWAQRYHSRGSRFYRTGDLVRLNLNGTCSFLGRRNQLTKLRGQRLDLAEIEHHLLRAFGPDANGIVTVIRPPASGTAPCLVAVIQIVSSPDPVKNDASSSSTMQKTGIFRRHTRNFLSRAHRTRDELNRKLPRIMVPDLYLQASTLPLMVSGKVNRRSIDTHCAGLSPDSLHALGSLDLHGASKEEDTLHEDKEPIAWDLSRHIAQVLQRKTEQDDLAARVSGRNAVLSCINLDSIDMMALSQFVYKKYHCKLPITTLFRRDLTVRQVADMIEKTPNQSIHDFCSENAAVNNSIVPAPEWWIKVQTALDKVRRMPGTDTNSNDYKPRKTVFLSGATGYLGTHILRQLVRDHRVSMVYVLVRARCPDGAFARIIQEARTAQWWQDDYRRVIEAWPGDLSQPQLGLSDRHWDILRGHSVDAIIHNGAVVHWGYDYEVLEPANVHSTLQLLQAIAHSSTTVSFTYVSALIPVDDAFSADLEHHLPAIDIPDGYTRTKYASELLITEFARSHPSLRHRLRIVRPGFIIGTVNDGIANVDDMLWRVVATAVTTGSYNASEPDSWLFVSAVDWTANLITYETLHTQPMSLSANSTVVRLSMTDGLSMRDFWQAVSLGLGRKLAPISAAEWMATLEKQVDAVGISHILLSVMDFLRSSGGCLGISPASLSSSSSPATSSQLPVPRDQPASLTNMIRLAVVRNAEYLASLEGLSAMITATSAKIKTSGGLQPSTVFTRRNKIAAPA